MGKARRFLPVFLLFFLVQGSAVGQQPLHWDATIDSAKATATQSHRLVLLFFCASYCGPCHRMENDIRNQPGAVSALEANFVPVKVSIEYYPTTAKQYGVTRVPTTIILAPTARGEVLAVIPEAMPVDQYLAKLNTVVAEAKRRETEVFAQIQPSPPVGSAAAIGRSLPAGAAASANAVPAAQFAATVPPVGPVQNQAIAAASPAANSLGAARPSVAAPTANAAAGSSMVAMATGSGQSGSRPMDLQKSGEAVKRPANLLFGLDGFCPVQLVENYRWEPGKKAWGAVHRGRTYLFAGPEEQRRFLAKPDHYAPVSSGDDVVLLLEQGRSVSGHREHGLQFDGHVYLFAGEGTLDKFRSNPRYYAERALQAALRPVVQTAAVR